MTIPVGDIEPVKCTIIGASLEGLTCAYLLHKAGHQVLVVDKASRDRRVFERGLRLTPNVARLLLTLPGCNSLRSKATTASCLEYIEGSTSQTIGQTEFFSDVMQDLGSDFLMCGHNDFVDRCRKLCQECGIGFRYSTEITSLSLSDVGDPILHTQSGETIHSDVVIGADGQDGISHTFVSQSQSDGASTVSSINDEDSEFDLHRAGIHHISGSTYSIPVSSMQDSPKLWPLLESTAIKLWMEKDIMVLGSLHGPDHYVVAAMTPTFTESSDPDIPESERLPRLLGQCDSLVHDLIGLAESSCQGYQPVPESSPQVVDVDQKIVLLGNSGVVGPFYGIYCESIPIEGAFTLARLFSRLSSKAMLRIMLDGFQKIRDPRNLAVLSSELSAAALMTLSPGPARTNRDAELAVSLTREDGAASHVWAATLVQFDYDAVEAADSWWHNWGRFVVEGKGA